MATRPDIDAIKARVTDADTDVRALLDYVAVLEHELHTLDGLYATDKLIVNSPFFRVPLFRIFTIFSRDTEEAKEQQELERIIYRLDEVGMTATYPLFDMCRNGVTRESADVILTGKGLAVACEVKDYRTGEMKTGYKPTPLGKKVFRQMFGEDC